MATRGKPLRLRYVPEMWDYFRAFYPKLFDGNELRHGITADDVLGPLKGKKIGQTFGYIIASLVTDFADHVATPRDLERLWEEIERLEIDPAAWAATQQRGLANGARRFGDGNEFSKKIEEVVSDPADNDQVLKIHEWAAMEGERPPLAAHLWESRSLKLKNLMKLAELVLRLPVGVREDVLAIVDDAGLAKLFVLPEAVNKWLDTLTKDPSRYFSDPMDTLHSAAGLYHKVKDREWFVRVYLPAYVHALSDPFRLVEVFSHLPRASGLIAPPLSTSERWMEMIDFMGRHGLNRNAFALWYTTVLQRESEVLQHFRIACSSRLRTSFMKVWTAVHKEPTPRVHILYYREFLEGVAAETGLTVDQLDAWLAWRHVMPTAKDRFEHLDAGRHQPLRLSKQFGTLLREHTMTLDRPFDQMRKLPHRASECETEWNRIKAVLQETRNHFASYHTRDDKKGKVVEALATLETSPVDVWHRLDEWKAGGAEASTLAYIEMVFTELDFHKPPPARKKRISPQNTFVGNRAHTLVARKRGADPAEFVAARPELSATRDWPMWTEYGIVLNTLVDLIEGTDADLNEGQYEHFSRWAEHLNTLAENNKDRELGIERLADELGKALAPKGLDVRVIIDDALKKGFGHGEGEGSGSSSTPQGMLPSDPVPPATPPAVPNLMKSATELPMSAPSLPMQGITTTPSPLITR